MFNRQLWSLIDNYVVWSTILMYNRNKCCLFDNCDVQWQLRSEIDNYYV